MLFSELDAAAPDVILGIAQAFRADSSPHKVDLGIGIYKDDHGQSPVLPSVKAAGLTISSKLLSLSNVKG